MLECVGHCTTQPELGVWRGSDVGFSWELQDPQQGAPVSHPWTWGMDACPRRNQAQNRDPEWPPKPHLLSDIPELELLTGMLVPLAFMLWLLLIPQARMSLHETWHTLPLDRPPNGRGRQSRPNHVIGWVFCPMPKLSDKTPNQGANPANTLQKMEMSPPTLISKEKGQVS